MKDFKKTEAMIMWEQRHERRIRALMASRFDQMIAERHGSVRAALRSSASEIAMAAAYVPRRANASIAEAV